MLGNRETKLDPMHTASLCSYITRLNMKTLLVQVSNMSFFIERFFTVIVIVLSIQIRSRKIFMDFLMEIFVNKDSISKDT